MPLRQQKSLPKCFVIKRTTEMTDEQQERAISFALDLLNLVNNELVVGHWETFSSMMTKELIF